MDTKEVDRLVQSYRRAASETGPDKPARSNNKAVDHLHAAFKVLRTSAEGRTAISSLMSDPDLNVRIWAASHSLMWDVERAREALSGIAAMEDLLGFNAKMTLREFDAGRLSFDY